MGTPQEDRGDALSGEKALCGLRGDGSRAGMPPPWSLKAAKREGHQTGRLLWPVYLRWVSGKLRARKGSASAWAHVTQAEGRNAGLCPQSREVLPGANPCEAVSTLPSQAGLQPVCKKRVQGPRPGRRGRQPGTTSRRFRATRRPAPRGAEQESEAAAVGAVQTRSGQRAEGGGRGEALGAEAPPFIPAKCTRGAGMSHRRGRSGSHR